MSLSKNPAFNLKVVLQETNLAADTLRAWERRYGLPAPQRTAGGHRLYSQYDIEMIKWLLARQAEGLSISRAVDLWNEHNASGVDPLDGFSPSILSPAQATPALYIPPNTNLDFLRGQWIEACMKFSELNSERVLNQAFSMFPVEAVCINVLQKGMAEIGRLCTRTEHQYNRSILRQVWQCDGWMHCSAHPPPQHAIKPCWWGARPMSGTPSQLYFCPCSCAAVD